MAKLSNLWFKELERKVIALDEINVKKPIQVMLDYSDYMDLKQFCSRYNATISECVRILITDHLKQVQMNGEN